MPSISIFHRTPSHNRTSSQSSRHAVDEGVHEFKPPGPNDLRSVCPALNTLANHGYLPHDGKDISFSVLSHALQKGYGCSSLLADFLTLGGYILLRRSVLKHLNLIEVGRHNRIEHNASVVHDDDDDGAGLAPTNVDPTLLHKFLTKAYSPDAMLNKEGKDVITIRDIARTRVAREEASQPVDPLHAEIARGEFALVLDIFGKGPMKTLDADDLQHWLDENRFPPGWSPSHQEQLWDTMSESKHLRALMQRYKGEEPHSMLSELEKLAQSPPVGHGLFTAVWRVVETMVLKIDKALGKQRDSTGGKSTPERSNSEGGMVAKEKSGAGGKSTPKKSNSEGEMVAKEKSGTGGKSTPEKSNSEGEMVAKEKSGTGGKSTPERNNSEGEMVVKEKSATKVNVVEVLPLVSH